MRSIYASAVVCAYLVAVDTCHGTSKWQTVHCTNNFWHEVVSHGISAVGICNRHLLLDDKRWNLQKSWYDWFDSSHLRFQYDWWNLLMFTTSPFVSCSPFSLEIFDRKSDELYISFQMKAAAFHQQSNVVILKLEIRFSPKLHHKRKFDIGSDLVRDSLASGAFRMIPLKNQRIANLFESLKKQSAFINCNSMASIAIHRTTNRISFRLNVSSQSTKQLAYHELAPVLNPVAHMVMASIRPSFIFRFNR